MKKVILMAMVIGSALTCFSKGTGDIGSVGESTDVFNTDSIQTIFQNYEMTCEGKDPSQIFYMSLEGKNNTIYVKHSEQHDQNKPDSRAVRYFSSEIKNQKKFIRKSECEDPGCFFGTKYYIDSRFTKTSIRIDEYTGSTLQSGVQIIFDDETLTSGTLVKEAYWPGKNFVSQCQFKSL